MGKLSRERRKIWGRTPAIRGAQHKRPGAAAKRLRQQRAQERVK